ncbi:hypothetical protein D3C76_1506000 [compost metagenome]
MAAFSARRLVCWEILVITSKICPMFTVFTFSTSILVHESLIFADRRCRLPMASPTTCWPSTTRPRAALECWEANAAFWAISWVAAPSSLIAAATLLVRLAC